MADILTQLQDCFDQLSTQFTASLSHPLHHAPLPPVTPPPSHATIPPHSTNNQTPLPPPPSSNHNPSTNPPANPSTTPFTPTLHELATDLLHKTSQINILIAHLPTTSSRPLQEARLQALESELVAVEQERGVAVRGRERALGGLEGVIAGARR